MKNWGGEAEEKERKQQNKEKQQRLQLLPLRVDVAFSCTNIQTDNFEQFADRDSFRSFYDCSKACTALVARVPMFIIIHQAEAIVCSLTLGWLGFASLCFCKMNWRASLSCWHGCMTCLTPFQKWQLRALCWVAL